MTRILRSSIQSQKVSSPEQNQLSVLYLHVIKYSILYLKNSLGYFWMKIFYIYLQGDARRCPVTTHVPRTPERERLTTIAVASACMKTSLKTLNIQVGLYTCKYRSTFSYVEGLTFYSASSPHYMYLESIYHSI